MLENEISRFMLKFSKFEFFLINECPELATTSECDRYGAAKVTGLDWNRIANKLEEAQAFTEITEQFPLLAKEPPQFLVFTKDRGLKWDSDEIKINSWHNFLTRSLAQLRNNIAHGNKSHQAAPFTHGRTKEFIIEANELIDFIIETITGDNNWETEITFS